jgi:NADP oxidoreductase coenzyme F420-dependent
MELELDDADLVVLIAQSPPATPMRPHRGNSHGNHRHPVRTAHLGRGDRGACIRLRVRERNLMQSPDMKSVGIIGAGHIGQVMARIALRAGRQVVIANSRGPESLTSVVRELGEGSLGRNSQRRGSREHCRARGDVAASPQAVEVLDVKTSSMSGAEAPNPVNPAERVRAIILSAPWMHFSARLAAFGTKSSTCEATR